jgi:nicotinamidase/pyrazinamidase
MDCLLLLDLQNDFLPGGALAVPHGDKVLSVANAWMSRKSLVVATQDWHPRDHISFASQHENHEVGEELEIDGLLQMLWPDHCVAGTEGAELSSSLELGKIDHRVKKGTDRQLDSYSGFFANGRKKSTGLHSLLQEKNVGEIFLMGLATDYCVKYTALDAVYLGYRTHLILPGCRGVDRPEGNVEQSLEEMESAGVEMLGV